MSETRLGTIFSNEGIKDFGTAFRKAVRDERNKDYASLVELEYVETPEEFSETIKKFLRRFETYANKYHIKRPEDRSLEEIMTLVDQYGVKPVRAAIIAHALVKATKTNENQNKEK